MTDRSRWTLIIVALAIMLLVLTVLGIRRSRGMRKPGPKERLELLADKNVGLGHLENDQAAEALLIFERMVERLPQEPLGHRNGVVALLIHFSKLRDDEKPTMLDRLQSAADRLLEVDSESAAARHLGGRVYRDLADFARFRDETRLEVYLGRAREHLREAARREPQDAAPLYEMYTLERSLGDPQRVSEEALQILQSAGRRAPENLAYLFEYLEQQAARGHSEIDTTFQQLLRVLPPASSQSPEEARARESLKEAEQKPAAGYANIVKAHNFFKSQPAYQYDLGRIQPHLLEFVLYDFQPGFYDRLPADAERPIGVRFEAFQPLGEKTIQEITAFAYDDVDGDETPDFVLVRKGGQAGTTIVEVVPGGSGAASFSPLEVQGNFHSLRLADFDLDIKVVGPAQPNLPADLDLVLFGPDGVRLIENREQDGKRSWLDRTADACVPKLPGVRWLLVCDMDHEGNLDLVVGLEKGVRILRNRGNWTVDDITKMSPSLESLETTAAAYGDFDRDGDLDFLLSASSGEMIFLDNRRSGRFVARTIEDDIQRRGGKLGSATALSALDVNNDGWLDFFAGRLTVAATYVANPSTVPPQHAKRSDFLVNSPVLEAGVFDFDNDGWLDVWMATEHAQKPLRILRNTRATSPDAVFEEHALGQQSPGPVRSVVVADIDQDGDQDVLFLGSDGLQGLRNQGGNDNRWLDLRLRALLSREASQGRAAKCNYYGVGGTVEIRAGRHYQMQQVPGPTTHFGLGHHGQADMVRVIWTNGVPQATLRPKANQILVEDQKPKGSCPFLFSWDGERFVFATDCLWSSGLGMKLAPDVYLDHRRQHNYLVVPGDKVRPRNGRYVFQWTHELWEAPFFDQAELWAVDHPADVEIYTDQRVPPDPEKPARILTVKQRRAPVAARDHRNRDVLKIVQHKDGNYLGGFERRRYVGFAEPHWLELDLGDLRGARQIMLYLTGWIWPTDTSANLAIAQDARLRPESGVIGGFGPPTVLVSDGKGGWQTAVPSMGFPPSKMQTVAVDLTGKFPTNDYRVRVATTMELYWDQVFFTVDEPAVPIQVTKVPVAAADLHYRGFSRTYQSSPTSPHLFDYDDVDPDVCWLPVPGRYTRYGDVTPLLHKPDCQYIIMSPGDELTISFNALPPTPPGHKRTFIFYGNGWLKDFDLNADSGDRVEPLPFDGMSRYPYAEPEHYPRTPEHDAYRRMYLTREEKGERFWEDKRVRSRRESR